MSVAEDVKISNSGDKDLIKKLETFDLGVFIDKYYFSNDESQNYLIVKLVFNGIPKLTGYIKKKKLHKGLMSCQKGLLPLLIHQTIVLLQGLLFFIITQK